MAGQVGYIAGTASVVSNLSVSNTNATITSQPLSPGVWIISYQLSVTTNSGYVQAWLTVGGSLASSQSNTNATNGYTFTNNNTYTSICSTIAYTVTSGTPTATVIGQSSTGSSSVYTGGTFITCIRVA